MSLMNCMFTVRWSDENNKPHSKTYANEADARKAKQWLLERGVRDVDIAVRINNKPAGGLQNDEKKSESTAEQKGFWWQE
nr:MAG TPA: Heat induced stress protein YflT [Caudoviricetes sp.]